MATYSAYSNVASGMTGIDPLSLSSLELYLNSATSFALTGTHNMPVSGWQDLSGHSPTRDATQGSAASKPLLQVSSNASPSGMPLVRFDGIDDFMASSSFIFPGPSSGHTFYFLGRLRLVAAPPAPFAFAVLFTDQDTDASPQIGYEANPSGSPFTRTASGTVVFSSGVIYGPWQLFIVKYTPIAGASGVVTAYRATYGTDVVQLDKSGLYQLVNTTAGYRLSENVGGNGSINADLAAVVWFSDTHSLSTMRGIREYLKFIFGEEG